MPPPPPPLGTPYGAAASRGADSTDPPPTQTLRTSYFLAPPPPTRTEKQIAPHPTPSSPSTFRQKIPAPTHPSTHPRGTRAPPTRRQKHTKKRKNRGLVCWCGARFVRMWPSLFSRGRAGPAWSRGSLRAWPSSWRRCRLARGGCSPGCWLRRPPAAAPLACRAFQGAP